jgi:thiamine biosynthesis lipoprotein
VTPAAAVTRLCRVEHIMGTAIVIDVRDARNPEVAVDAAFDHFRDVDARFSTFKPDSEISRLNTGELSEQDCSDQLREVLGMCELARQISDGYFDIRGHRRDGTLDPSGLVKGWSVDGAAQILDEAGVRNFSINAAGDVIARGHVAPGESWRIGVRNPWDASTTVAVVSASDLAIATSGTYERGDHIINPHTARPPDGIASMTVVGPSLTWADTWATAAYAMGIRGVDWIAREVGGYEACAISTDRHLVMTPGFEGFLAAR